VIAPPAERPAGMDLLCPTPAEPAPTALDGSAMSDLASRWDDERSGYQNMTGGR
jgi:hypothetical protein